MEVKEKREIPIAPVILKFGLAVAISLGGALFTYLRFKHIKPPKPKSKCSPGNDNQAHSRIENGERRNDDLALQNSSLIKVSARNSITGHSSDGDGDSFLLPDFNDLEKECNIRISMDSVCFPIKNGSDFLEVEYKCSEHDEQERENRRLRNLVNILQEKERNLELQLLEYYGIKEQETAVRELQNQLKLNTMEAKLYNLKIESLLLDNRRLQAQVADYANSTTDLEAAKGKIKMLKKKLRFEMERNRDQILKLQDRVMNIQEHERKAAEIDQERETLKTKLEEMRICNQVLKQENWDLVQKLDYCKMLAPNALDDEVLQLREERRHLKEQNEDSRKKIERLQDDRCKGLEELVYLRWINTCLRCELRNCHPDGGKYIDRGLCKNLSPRMEDEAKKLILEFANNESPGDKMMDTKYMDSDQWSPSQASCLTDERDDHPVDPLAANKTNNNPSKKKLFAKLRRLLRGKSSTNLTPGRSPSSLQRTASIDHIPGRISCEFPSESEDVMKPSGNLSRASPRRSFDIPRSYSRGAKSIGGGSSSSFRRTTDDSSSVLAQMESLTEFNNNWSPAKDDLLNFVEALKNCHMKSSRSSISYESI